MFPYVPGWEPVNRFLSSLSISLSFLLFFFFVFFPSFFLFSLFPLFLRFFPAVPVVPWPPIGALQWNLEKSKGDCRQRLHLHGSAALLPSFPTRVQSRPGLGNI